MPPFLDIVLIGAPGSGKGTQAFKLLQKNSAKHLSTGDLFRKHLKQKTKLGLLAQSYIDKGQLVPDGVTNDMVKDFMNSVIEQTLVIWDGYPRNWPQTQAFETLLNQKNRQKKRVFYLKISDKEIINRLSGRLYAPQSGKIYHITNHPPKTKGICDVSGEKLIQRSDDKKELIQARLKVFHELTQALLDYYDQQGVLKEVSASQNPDKVFQDIQKHLGF